MSCRAAHTVCMADENGVLTYYKPGTVLPAMSEDTRDDLLSRKAIECDKPAEKTTRTNAAKPKNEVTHGNEGN